MKWPRRNEQTFGCTVSQKDYFLNFLQITVSLIKNCPIRVRNECRGAKLAEKGFSWPKMGR